MIPVSIQGTSSLLPGRRWSTAEVAREAGRSPEAVLRKTGIEFRHWQDVGAERSCAELGAEALGAALEAAGMPATALRRIIFASSSSGDLITPATANLIAARLGLRGSCDAFDLNNACMGFLTALDTAGRFVATGGGPVGVVVGEVGLRRTLLKPSESRPFLVFGEAMAAAVLGPAHHGEGMLGVHLSNDGSQPPGLTITNPIRDGQPPHVQFLMSNADVGEQALAGLIHATRALLADTGLRMQDIEWVLPHQPNGAMLRMILKALEVDPARTVPVVQDIGSVAAASIAVSLDRLLRTRPVQPGQRILMLGIGAGVSRGAILYQVGQDGRVREGSSC